MLSLIICLQMQMSSTRSNK